MGGHDAMHDPLEVDVDTTIPGGGGERMIGVKRERHDPGIVHPNIYATIVIQRMVSQRLHLLELSCVLSWLSLLPMLLQ